MRWKEVYSLGKDTFLQFSDNGGPLLSAALAFYAILSTAPLILVAISVAGLIFGQDAASGELQRELTRYLGAAGAQAVGHLVESLRNTSAGQNATIIGFILLLYAASRLFSQIQDAINQLWHVRTEFKDIKVGLRATLYKKLLSFAMVLALGGVLSALIIISALAAALHRFFGTAVLGSPWLWSLSTLLMSLLMVTLLFALLYRLLPDATVSWRDAFLGSSVTAVVFTLAEYPLSFYLAHQGVESAYGAAGSLVVFLLWVYYAAQIFFLGAQFTRVYAEASGRGVQADASAVLIREVVAESGSSSHSAAQ